MIDRDAKCIDVLQAQIAAAYPGRATGNDGTGASPEHHAANPTSDHEYDSRGICHAVDFTHDLSVGFDSYKFADYMAGLAPGAPKPDPRIKYIISNKRIWNPSVAANKWRPYGGPGKDDHEHHVHISINKEGEDDTRSWDIGPVPISIVIPDAPKPARIMRRGHTGADVEELQRLLGVGVDGSFGPGTDKAVRDYQRSHSLIVDGIAGPATVKALRTAVPPIEQTQSRVFTNIIASVFGGSGEIERSAYDRHRIGEREYTVALPFRFVGVRPKVKVTNPENGKSVICTIEDIGPWNINDPYWETPNGKPQAASGKDLGQTGKVRRTNKAGIDLSPAAARAIGVDGLALVDWQFV